MDTQKTRDPFCFPVGEAPRYSPAYHASHPQPQRKPAWLRRLQTKDLTEFAPATRDLTGQVLS